MKTIRISFFIALGCAIAAMPLQAANPIFVAKAWLGIKTKSVVWYFDAFKNLDQKEQKTIFKTLKLLRAAVQKGLEITDKENISAHMLQAIPVVAHGYVLAKTWSARKADRLVDIVLHPIMKMALDAFADKYDLDKKLSYDQLIAQSGLQEHEAVYEIYELGLQAIKACLWWAGWSVKESK